MLKATLFWDFFECWKYYLFAYCIWCCLKWQEIQIVMFSRYYFDQSEGVLFVCLFVCLNYLLLIYSIKTIREKYRTEQFILIEILSFSIKYSPIYIKGPFSDAISDADRLCISPNTHYTTSCEANSLIIYSH